MTTKTETRKRPGEATGPARPPQEQMKTAYQVHTLAHLLYGHMNMRHPWDQPMFRDPMLHAPAETYGMPHWGSAWPTPTWAGPTGYPFVRMNPLTRFPR